MAARLILQQYILEWLPSPDL